MTSAPPKHPTASRRPRKQHPAPRPMPTWKTHCPACQGDFEITRLTGTFAHVNFCPNCNSKKVIIQLLRPLEIGDEVGADR